MSIPWGENSRYDLIVDTGERLFRVPCKTASLCGSKSYASTCLRFHAYSHKITGGKFRGRESYRGKADLFAAYAPTTGSIYILPVDEVPETDVWLRLEPVRNGQKTGVRMAEDCTLERWAENVQRDSRV